MRDDRHGGEDQPRQVAVDRCLGIEAQNGHARQCRAGEIVQQGRAAAQTAASRIGRSPIACFRNTSVIASVGAAPVKASRGKECLGQLRVRDQVLHARRGGRR